MGIVPLAIPITAGPGAISTVIIANATHLGVTNQVYMTICGALVALVMTPTNDSYLKNVAQAQQ